MRVYVRAMWARMCICVRMRVYAYMYVCMYVCVYACTYVCTHVCMRMYMCDRVYTRL